MGSYWSEISKDRERRRRDQRRTDAWVRKELNAEVVRQARRAASASGVSQAEQARLDRAIGTADADMRNADLARELASMVDALAAVVAMPARTIDAMREDVPLPEFEPPDLERLGPLPVWLDYAPPEPGFLGRRKYEKSIVEAKASYNRACDYHARLRDDAIASARGAYESRLADARREHHERWDAIAGAVNERDSDTIAELVGVVLHAIGPLHGLIGGGRAVYQTDSCELVVEIDLPDTDVIPAERAWRYVYARRAVESQPRSLKDSAQLYADLISRITLAVTHVCFRSFDRSLVDTVTINGHVRTIDPATGRADHPCLVTVTASRVTFEDLVLDEARLKPKKCLAALGAELSPHPYDLEHIEPFIDFDLAKYRLVTAAEALVDLDNTTDLLKMDPYDFERLVKRLFIAMGYETWRTTSSRDDGIDAVAIKSDPLFPFECVIQAKRYHKVVPPKELQALMGAMAESGTATHGVLVTTSWLSARSRQRARAQRITTIERNELAYLIEEHLDQKVVISNKPPRS